MMDSLSCSRADAASRKASTLADTREPDFLHFTHKQMSIKEFGCVERAPLTGARTPAACCSSVPHFQLIQTFQELSGAVSHGQSPAELRVEGFVHFGLYFRLSHGGERWWRPGTSFCAVWSQQRTARPGWLRWAPPGRFPYMGF